MTHYFITAIDTDSGKTLVSAIVTEALKADYWKPIQCGPTRDTETVQSLVSNTSSAFHDEAVFLKKPASPHDAARAEGTEVRIVQLLPAFDQLSKQTVIEGAGGLMVPVNNDEFIADIPARFNIPVILVANLYLGSINHTLLSVNELQRRGQEVAGIIFNGEPNPESERIILHHSGYRKLLHILPEKEINREVVRHYADQLRANWPG